MTTRGSRLDTGRTTSNGRAPSPARPLADAGRLEKIYHALLETHGPQQWWPTAAEDEETQRLEICLGAILTQNTSWSGAAKALEHLHAAGALSCAAILAMPHDVLAELVRPSGHFNMKARKLQEFARVLCEEYGGSVDALLDGEPSEVRERLLGIWGIGPETADAMTLYAARLPTFVAMPTPTACSSASTSPLPSGSTSRTGASCSTASAPTCGGSTSGTR